MKLLMLLILLCNSATAQLVPLDLPNRGTSTRVPGAGAIQIELVGGVRTGAVGTWSDGGAYPATMRRYDGTRIDAVMRWGIADRSEVGIRLELDAINWQNCEMSRPGFGLCQAMIHSRAGTAVAVAIKSRLYAGDELVPAVALRSSARFAEWEDIPGPDQSTSIRLGLTAALSNRIGDNGELGYGLGVDNIGFAESDPAGRGHYWIGLDLPLGSWMFLGPQISGDVAVGSAITPTNPALRNWLGATVRIAPESWPLFHLDARVSEGFDDALDYEIRIGAALASFRL